MLYRLLIIQAEIGKNDGIVGRSGGVWRTSEHTRK
jgi:hypothetical protein